MITADELRRLLAYDPDTGVFTWRAKSARNSYARVGDVAGWINKKYGYRRISVMATQHQAHRLAWLYVHGEWPAQFIDHVNGDRSDNRFSNLRLATHAENMCNRPKPRTNTSGYKGVSWCRRDRRWRVKIKVNGQHHHIGRFATQDEAHAAYCEAAKKLHGEFANSG